jgi:type IV secretory pathway TrbD component
MEVYMSCGITNLGSCLVEKFFSFVANVLNMPVRPLLTMINNLMIEPVNISIFSGTWAIIIYILSLFYGIFLLVVGFQFMLSGHSPEKRDKAKRSLANILIMMVLIQLSFFIYSLSLDVISSLTSVIYGFIPVDFFMITSDNFANLGLELVLILPYVMTLVITLIFLALRYICVGIGVVFFAIGIFFYFLEPLESYGKLILNHLGVLISLPFFYAIILLASSKFIELDLFADMKILLMIGGFSLINLVTIFLLLFVIFKSANAIAKPVGQVVKVVSAVA